MEELSLQDIKTILKRRKKVFLTAALSVFAVMMIFIMSWSNYRSIALVRIEQSYIPANIATSAGMNVNDAVVALADQRISQVEQKVTSPESLSDIIAKFNIYPDAVGRVPTLQLTAKMRKKIKLELIGSVISNPAAAMKETAEQLSAIAFSLSFDYSDPKIAQQVVSELVTRFMDEDLKQRRTQAQETSAFVSEQIKQLEASMAEQEKAIAEFRAAHGESGPAALMFNEQANMTATLNIQSLDSQIAANEGTQGNLRAQLATTEPYSRVIADGQVLTTPAVQLKALEAQYAALTAQYGPNHPDVVKARHQIQSLKAQLNAPDDSAALEAKIADVRTNLSAAEETYGPDHPDVISLKRQLKSLEKRRDSASETSSDTIKRDADNPAYLQLSAQLMSAEEQHKTLLTQRSALMQQQEKYEKNLADNPTTDQQMSQLSRDYDNAKLRYRELKEKKMSADMMEQLEQSQKSQRFVVLNPPEVPTATQPAQILFFLGGIVLSLAAGIGSVALAEITNQSVRSAQHLSSIVGALPLVVIPRIYAGDEPRWQNSSVLKESLVQNLLPVISETATRLHNDLCHWLASLHKNK